MSETAQARSASYVSVAANRGDSPMSPAAVSRMSHARARSPSAVAASASAQATSGIWLGSGSAPANPSRIRQQRLLRALRVAARRRRRDLVGADDGEDTHRVSPLELQLRLVQPACRLVRARCQEAQRTDADRGESGSTVSPTCSALRKIRDSSASSSTQSPTPEAIEVVLQRICASSSLGSRNGMERGRMRLASSQAS